MTKVIYVVKTKKGGTCEVTSYKRAQEIISEYGGTYTVRYEKITEENVNKGKYAGVVPKTKYKPPYIDPIYKAI